MRLSKTLWCSVFDYFLRKALNLQYKLQKSYLPRLYSNPPPSLLVRRLYQLSYWAFTKLSLKIRLKSPMSTLFLNLFSDGHLRTNWYIKYTSVKFHLINSAGVLGSYPAIVKICIQTRTDHRMIVWVLFYASSKFVSLL